MQKPALRRAHNMAKSLEEQLEAALERGAELKAENAELRAARKTDESALRTRERENRDHRQQIKDLEAKVGELEGSLPQEGSVVITSDDAAQLTAYREIGDLTSVQTRLGELDEARAAARTLERRDTLRDVAQAEGWKLNVLEEQLDGVELKVVESDDGPQPSIAQPGKAAMTVREYIESERPDYLAALDAGTQRPPRAPVGPGPSPKPPREKPLSADEIYEQQRTERPVSL
jgi:hypothetical protein